MPSTSTSALSRAHPACSPRRVSTAPADASMAGRHAAQRSGMPDGSSWSRNRWHRSASSCLADRRRHLAETTQRPEETPVRRLGPAHVAAPPPPVGPQRVEPPVVADPVAGIPLDRVASEIAERRPRVEEAGRRRRRPRRPPARRSVLGKRERGGEASASLGVRCRQHRGREARGHVDRLVAHDRQRTDRAVGRCRRLPAIAVRGAAIRVRPCSDSASTKAKNVALVAATVFVIGAIAAIWIMKTIVQKVLVAVAADHAGLRRLVATRVAPGMRRAGPGEHRRSITGATVPTDASPTSTDVRARCRLDAASRCRSARHDVHVLRCRRDDPVTASPGDDPAATARRPGCRSWASSGRRWPPSPARRPWPTPRCGGYRRSCRRSRPRSAPRPRSSPRPRRERVRRPVDAGRRRPSRSRPRTARDGRVARPRVGVVAHRPRRDRSRRSPSPSSCSCWACRNYTVAGHTWISHRVAYRWRARSFGIFEMSWALALLVGAPIVAVLINQFGWRGPFVALAIAPRSPPSSSPGSSRRRPRPIGRHARPAASSDVGDDEHPDGALSDLHRRPPLTATAWLVVSGSALMALAGISVFVISGSWLDDAFGVSTSGIGVVAMGLGAVELIASSEHRRVRRPASASCAARSPGSARSSSGWRSWSSPATEMAVGVVGLLVFLLGFEYGFVTSLSLTSEAMPEARGATLAIGNAVGTLARGGGTIVSGVLYGAFGIGGHRRPCPAAPPRHR